jgi:hypothetical protein
VRWREKGHRLELAGREAVDGVDCWKLELTRADGPEETWYLDAATFLEAVRVAPVTDFGEPHTQRIYFSDFREVAGVKLPFRIESEYFIRYQIADVEKVEANAPVDPALFALPRAPELLRLAPLAGTWAVTSESQAFPGAPWRGAPGRATITPVLDGQMLEERLTYPVVGRPIEAVRLWSWDRFHAVFRLAHGDAYTTHLAVFEGPAPAPGAGDDRLVLSNLGTDSAWKVYDETAHGRWILHGVSAAGFKADYEESTDGGETWTPLVKLTYEKEG